MSHNREVTCDIESHFNISLSGHPLRRQRKSKLPRGMSLGTRAQIPSGDMVITLGLHAKSNPNAPGGYMLVTFWMRTAIWPKCTHRKHGWENFECPNFCDLNIPSENMVGTFWMWSEMRPKCIRLRNRRGNFECNPIFNHDVPSVKHADYNQNVPTKVTKMSPVGTFTMYTTWNQLFGPHFKCCHTSPCTQHIITMCPGGTLRYILVTSMGTFWL